MRSDYLSLQKKSCSAYDPVTGFLEVPHGVGRPTILPHHPTLLAAKWAVGIAAREQNATYGNSFFVSSSENLLLKVCKF